MKLNRSTSIVLTLLATAVCGWWAAQAQDAPDDRGHASNPSSKESPMVTVRLIGPDGKLTDPVQTGKVVRSDAEWREKLTPQEYHIARNHGTEPAFTGSLLENHDTGMYLCAACGLPLFDSETKFNSGTGWPSFYQPAAPENMLEHKDTSYGMTRTEVLCPRCGAHLGHVFEDGPRPTGLRYCINSAVLKFAGQDQLASMAEQPMASAAPAAMDDMPTSATADPMADASMGHRAETVFAGGCFWCVEAVFEQIDGVGDVVSGYAGGSAETANYDAVCGGGTGHAEAVKIVYDPSKVSLEQLLKVHFATHDPTTLNRQGNDVGTQYRSTIFYADEAEKKRAEAFIAHLGEEKTYGGKKIVTTLEPLEKFYEAETHHQNYVCNNPYQPYVRSVAMPKVEKTRNKFTDMLKPDAQLKP